MRRLPVLIFLFSLIALPVGSLCADNPKLELYGGYSLHGHEGFSAGGWKSAVVFNFHQRLGIAAELSGHYEGSRAMHFFMFGPQFSGKKDRRFVPFCHLMAGGFNFHWSNWGGGSRSETGFAMFGGGGFDIRIGKNLAVRILQVDVGGVKFPNGSSAAGQASFGLVYRH